MRICYFNYEWDLEASTGAATQIAQTVASLERMGHQVLVVDRHRKPAHRVKGEGVAHSWLWETAEYWRSLKGIQVETKILRRDRPDVVLTQHGLRFSSLVAARRLGLPIVLQVNASVPYEIRRYQPGIRLMPAVSDRIERRMLGAADGVIVVSNVLRDYFVRRGLKPERVTVAPNGADTSRFRPEAADPAIRSRFAGRTLVGFAGSFARFHGIDLLEHAICHVARWHPEAHFVLAGGGPGAEGLQDRCRRRGCDRRVTFLGLLPHDRIPGVMAAMDVLLAPYAAQDSFYFSPIKLFEYMACGRAVLAARLGQIAEVIEDGENGALYDPSSVEDFVEKLLELLRDCAKCARLGARARQTIEDNYTWNHNARLVAQALEDARKRRLAAGIMPSDNIYRARLETSDESARPSVND